MLPEGRKCSGLPEPLLELDWKGSEHRDSLPQTLPPMSTPPGPLDFNSFISLNE